MQSVSVMFTSSLFGARHAPAASCRNPSGPGRHVAPGADDTPTYKTTPQGELKLHVFLPPGDAAQNPDASPRGALILFHGGGWVGGKAQAFFWQANYLASKGLVVMSADYRLGEAHGTTPLACVADAKSAVRFVRSNAATWNIDPDRIAVGGGSAGGHIAAGTAMLEGFDDPADPSPETTARPDALVLWNPVLDTSKEGFGHRRVGDNPAQLSPLHQVAEAMPPTLIFNGTDDKTATLATARAMEAKLTELGGAATVVAYFGETHAFFYLGKGEGRCFLDTVKRAEAFLIEHGILDASPAG